MIALSTRSLCDECGRPADRETDSGIFVCERCEAVPGSPTPISEGVPDSSSTPTESSFTTKGDCPGTEAPAPRNWFANDPADLDSALSGNTGACSSEREDVGATNSIPAPALGSSPSPRLATMQTADAPRGSARRVRATLEGRGPVEDWTDGSLAVRAVIYPAPRGASHGALNSSFGDCPASISPGRIDREGRVTAPHAPAVTGFNSNSDASSHPPASVNCGAVSPPAAAPLSIPADPEIEAAVSALEADWVRRANVSLANAAFCLKNSTSFAMRAFAPMSANLVHASTSSPDISST